MGCTSALVAGKKQELRNLALIPCKNKGGRGERERLGERERNKSAQFGEKKIYFIEQKLALYIRNSTAKKLAVGFKMHNN